MPLAIPISGEQLMCILGGNVEYVGGSVPEQLGIAMCAILDMRFRPLAPFGGTLMEQVCPASSRTSRDVLLSPIININLNLFLVVV